MAVYKKNYAAWIEASSDEHGAIDKAIAALQNTFNLTRWDAISYLFKLGTENALKYVEKEADRQEVRTALVRSRLIETIRKQSRDDNEIRKGMSELGYEAVVAAAAADGLPEDDVRAILDQVKADMPYKEAAAQWLDSYFSDYRTRSTDEVKLAAIKDGMLPSESDPSFDTRWSMMRSVASRLGLSGNGKWGEWQKKPLL